jgi:hypothetical protein
VGRRSGEPDAEPELRAYLLAEAIEFRRNHVEILLDPEHDWAEYAWRELSKPVDQLANGAAYSFHGYQLPDDHPMRSAFGPDADLLLDEHDVLRVVS